MSYTYSKEGGWRPVGGKERLSIAAKTTSRLGMQRSASPSAALERMCRGCRLKKFKHCTGLLPDASYPDTVFNATRTAPDDIPMKIFTTVYPCDEQID